MVFNVVLSNSTSFLNVDLKSRHFFCLKRNVITNGNTTKRRVDKSQVQNKIKKPKLKNVIGIIDKSYLPKHSTIKST